MKRFSPFLIFIGICCLIIGSAAITTSSTSAAASAAVDNLSPETNHELALARNATAKYHDFDRADADGYEFLACVPGEGLEYVNWSWLIVTSISAPGSTSCPEQNGTWVWVCGADSLQRSAEGSRAMTTGSLWRRFAHLVAEARSGCPTRRYVRREPLLPPCLSMFHDSALRALRISGPLRWCFVRKT
jgi:hypothetical protein